MRHSCKSSFCFFSSDRPTRSSFTSSPSCVFSCSASLSLALVAFSRLLTPSSSIQKASFSLLDLFKASTLSVAAFQAVARLVSDCSNLKRSSSSPSIRWETKAFIWSATLNNLENSLRRYTMPQMSVTSYNKRYILMKSSIYQKKYTLIWQTNQRNETIPFLQSQTSSNEVGRRQNHEGFASTSPPSRHSWEGKWK